MKVFLTLETIKWTFYTFFISVMAVIVVIGVGIYLDRDIKSDDIEFLLAKNNIENKFLGGGRTTSKEVEEIPQIGDRDTRDKKKYGFLVKVGMEEYIAQREVYDYKAFCGMKGTFVTCSDKFTDVYLVDDELKKVEIELVRKVG